MTERNVAIGGRLVGDDHPTYVIAEAGVNHNGQLAEALKLVEAAKNAGADAVKFQAFNPSEVVRRDSPKADYQEKMTGSGSQLEMLERLKLSDSEFAELASAAAAVGITFLCTPFDVASLRMLVNLDVKAIKTSSTDVTNVPFMREIARTGRPMIISTGASTLDEVLQTQKVITSQGAGSRAVFLHCSSEYPAPPEESNLSAIMSMKSALKTPVGYSDHTAGIGVAPFAVAMGASVIEKHLTLDRNAEGPDHAASLDPKLFSEMVDQIRLVNASKGDGVKTVMPCERENRTIIRRSLVARTIIRSGEKFTAENVALKRPATGLSPDYWDKLIGRRSKRSLQPDEMIAVNDVDWADAL
jgi:N,N'-diacetyllegionaminate synthase